MNIKKLLAGGLAAITMGATMALGAVAITSLGDYVATSDGTLTSPVIVVGDTVPAGGLSQADAVGRTTDVLAAADVAAATAGFATTTVTTGSVGVSVANGVDVSTTDKKLYFKSAMNRARSVITSAELPSVLASGTAVDLQGTEYPYDLYLTLGSKVGNFSQYGDSSGDPGLYLNIGSNTASAFYNATVVFTKNYNVSSTDVKGQEVTIFGNTYTVGSSSDVYAGGGTNNVLELYGAGNTQTINEGSSAVVSLDGTEHTIEVVGVSSSTVAVITVDGTTREVTEDLSYVIGGVNVYINDVYYFAKEGQVSSVKLQLGAEKLTLTHGSAVTKGISSTTTVEGTLVDIIGNDAGISKLTVSVVGPDSTNDYLLAGTAFDDPVFGNFEIAYNGLTPGLEDSTRDMITVDNSGNQYATVALTDYRGNAQTLTFAYTANTGANFAPKLNATSTKAYVVLENASVNKNDYVFLSPSFDSQFGHLMQLTDVKVTSVTATSPGYIKLKDVFSGTTSQYYLDATDGVSQIFIDGQSYFVSNTTATAGSAMAFRWGVGTAANSDAVGTWTTVFPTVKLKGGEWFTLTNNVTLPTTIGNVTGNNSFVGLELPTGTLNLSIYNTTTATEIHANGANTSAVYANTNQQTVEVTVGQVVYELNLSVGAATGAAYLDVAQVSLRNTYSNPAENGERVGVLVIQEQDNSTTKDVIFVPVGYTSAADGYMMVKIDADGITGDKDSASLTSNTYVTKYVNSYGTEVYYDSQATANGMVKIYYPDTQAVASVAVGSDPSFTTTGTSTVESATRITSPVSKLASELSSTAPGADLILIGGPCANALTAVVMAADNVSCGAWPHTTGVIKEYTGAFTDGSKALVVAGTTADDTRNLASMVMSGTLSYSA